MKLTYDAILKFMKGYFETFNKYGQDPKNFHRMDDFFAPDVEFSPYVAGIIHTKGRDNFYPVLLSHPSGYEKLTPEEIIVDERQGAAVVLIKAEISDSKTKEVLVTKRYFVLYPLALDEKKTIKIKKVRLFWEVLPPGTMEISDVFARDHKK
jgi:hypothetical protein